MWQSFLIPVQQAQPWLSLSYIHYAIINRWGSLQYTKVACLSWRNRGNSCNFRISSGLLEYDNQGIGFSYSWLSGRCSRSYGRIPQAHLSDLCWENKRAKLASVCTPRWVRIWLVLYFSQHNDLQFYLTMAIQTRPMMRWYNRALNWIKWERGFVL